MTTRTHFTTKPLTTKTWPDFAQLVEKHNGVWGGCWCMGFHSEGIKTGKVRALKEARVREDRAHAALVYEGAVCVGWGQFGLEEQGFRRVRRLGKNHWVVSKKVRKAPSRSAS